jgi:hypothetical protein
LKQFGTGDIYKQFGARDDKRLLGKVDIFRLFVSEDTNILSGTRVITAFW